MKILYLGDEDRRSTSSHRAAALRRCGHDVFVANTEPDNQSHWKRWLHYRTGYIIENRSIARNVLQAAKNIPFDLLWVDNGARVSNRLICHLKARGSPAINYNLDDPTGNRDGNRWFTFLRAIPAYDLLVVVRQENVREYYKRGASNVLRVFRSYDPVEHAPRVLSSTDAAHWESEVLFTGTWMPERGPFFRALAAAELPFTIRGQRWQKAKEWRYIQRHVAGGPIFGSDYVKAIQGAKVNLGLVSHGNRDLHTQRSAEIPFASGLLCAERTTEHTNLFKEGQEAFFWSSADECIGICRELLRDPRRCAIVKAAGRQRIIDLGLSNDVIVDKIISYLKLQKLLPSSKV